MKTRPFLFFDQIFLDALSFSRLFFECTFFEAILFFTKKIYCSHTNIINAFRTVLVGILGTQG